MNLTKKLIFGLLLAGALFTTACGDGDKEPKAGDACEKAEDCGDALTCNTTSKKCEEKKKPGDKLANGKTCDAHDKCTSDFCDLADTKTCKDLPGDKSVDDGKTCTKKEQCKTTGATCTDNKCTAPAPKLGDGETCDAHDKCTSGFCDLADTKKCAAVPGNKTVDNGKTCTKDEQCKATGATCTDNKCTVSTPKANDEACTKDAECTSKFCDIGGTNQCKAEPAAKSVPGMGHCTKSAQCAASGSLTGLCVDATSVGKGTICSYSCTQPSECSSLMPGLTCGDVTKADDSSTTKGCTH